MKLVIAEKAALARDIARAIADDPKEISDTEYLPIRIKDYTICALAGHVLALKEPADIDEKYGRPWKEDVLPIVLKPWEKEVVADKASLVEKIAKELESAEYVIHAGDPDDEGQLIVDEVLDYLGYTGKVLRVLISDSLPKNIRRALNSMVDNSEFKALGKAANARALADFAVGINESRLASIRLHQKLTVGVCKHQP